MPHLSTTTVRREGEESWWCKYKVHLAQGGKKEDFHHKHPPIPEAIVEPIYACHFALLGNYVTILRSR